MNNSTEKQKSRILLVLKFIILSSIGIYMFFIPIKSEGTTTIPIEYFVSYLTTNFKPICRIYAVSVMVIAAIVPFVKKTWKKNKVTAVFSIFKVIGGFFGILVFLGIGPEAILREDHGPYLFDSLAVQVGTLIPIGAIFLTFLMDYGFIDFIGQFLRPVMRKIWKTPGSSAVDGVASFMGSTAVGMLITNNMYVQRKYNTKEACIIATGFSTVCVSFFVIVAKTANLMQYWTQFFFTALIVTFAITAITVRIYPLSKKPETYYEGKEGDPEEKIEGSLLLGAWNGALEICEEAGPIIPNVIKNIRGSFVLVFEVLPNFMSIGLISLILANYTPVFDILGYIFYPITKLLRLPEPVLAAKAAFTGLAEMFLPVLLVKDAPLLTRFVLSVMSVTQVLMFSTTIPCIVATEIPISIKEMVIIWLERTILSFLIVVPIAHIIL